MLGAHRHNPLHTQHTRPLAEDMTPIYYFRAVAFAQVTAPDTPKQVVAHKHMLAIGVVHDIPEEMVPLEVRLLVRQRHLQHHLLGFRALRASTIPTPLRGEGDPPLPHVPNAIEPQIEVDPPPTAIPKTPYPQCIVVFLTNEMYHGRRFFIQATKLKVVKQFRKSISCKFSSTYALPFIVGSKRVAEATQQEVVLPTHP